MHRDRVEEDESLLDGRQVKRLSTDRQPRTHHTESRLEGSEEAVSTTIKNRLLTNKKADTENLTTRH